MVCEPMFATCSPVRTARLVIVGTALIKSSTENDPDLYPASAVLDCAPAIVPPVAKTLIFGSACADGVSNRPSARRLAMSFLFEEFDWKVFMAVFQVEVF